MREESRIERKCSECRKSGEWEIGSMRSWEWEKSQGVREEAGSERICREWENMHAGSERRSGVGNERGNLNGKCNESPDSQALLSTLDCLYWFPHWREGGEVLCDIALTVVITSMGADLSMSLNWICILFCCQFILLWFVLDMNHNIFVTWEGKVEGKNCLVIIV